MVFFPSLGNVYVFGGVSGVGGGCFPLDYHLADVFLGCDFGGNPAPSVAFRFHDAFLRYRGNGFIGGPPFDFPLVVPQGEFCLAPYLERHGSRVDPSLLCRISLSWRKG